MRFRLFFLPIFLFTLIFFLKSCRDDLDFDLANENLKIPKDSIFFDTILSDSKSQIYKLKVYNSENVDLEIPSIQLNNKINSLYGIYVNGISGPLIKSATIRKNDSLYIFIELNAKNISSTGNYTDEILIETKNGFQKVKLNSFIEKAIYFNPPPNQTESVISSNTIWDNSFVYYIDKKLRITNNSTLSIEPGTKVYFNKNSELIISNGSSLIVNGTIESKVVFRTNVHTNPTEQFPDQWNTINFENGSMGLLNNSVIKGGKSGLIISDANVKLENIEIYNQSSYGILASNATIEGKNIVINNCGDTSLRIERGGDYQFYHSIFANYSNFTSNSPLSLFLTNRGVENNKPLTKCIFGNCIFAGLSTNSIIIDNNFDSGLAFSYYFKNNLINYQDNPSDISNDSNFNLSMINQIPSFIDVSFKVNNLRFKPAAFPIGKGIQEYSNLVPQNIMGESRIHPSNLGAY